MAFTGSAVEKTAFSRPCPMDPPSGVACLPRNRRPMVAATATEATARTRPPSSRRFRPGARSGGTVGNSDDPEIARSASARSCAEENRSSGRFSRQRLTISVSAGAIALPVPESGVGSSLMIAVMVSTPVGLRNGDVPESISYCTQPKEKMSELEIGESLEKLVGYMKVRLPSQRGFVYSDALYSVDDPAGLRVVMRSHWSDWTDVTNHRESSALVEDQVFEQFDPHVRPEDIMIRTYAEVGSGPLSR